MTGEPLSTSLGIALAKAAIGYTTPILVDRLRTYFTGNERERLEKLWEEAILSAHRQGTKGGPDVRAGAIKLYRVVAGRSQELRANESLEDQLLQLYSQADGVLRDFTDWRTALVDSLLLLATNLKQTDTKFFERAVGSGRESKWATTVAHNLEHALRQDKDLRLLVNELDESEQAFVQAESLHALRELRQQLNQLNLKLASLLVAIATIITAIDKLT